MTRTPYFALPIAAAVLFASAAQAETRSVNALPSNQAAGRAAPAANAQGPKHGFPDNRGIAHALEEANEHARFKRHDSEG